jgi:hypothetical protein
VTRRVADTSRGQQVKLQPNNFTVRKSYTDLTSSTLKNTLNDNSNELHSRHSNLSSSGVCLSQTSLVLNSKNEKLLDRQNGLTTTQLDNRKQSPSGNLVISPSRNLAIVGQRMVPSQRTNYEQAEERIGSRRQTSDVKVDSIETAMSALETAISMLGTSAVKRSIADLSPQQADTHSKWIKSTKGPELSDEMPLGKNCGTAENANLQNTLKLLDKTIVEIDSAISVTDLAHHGTKSIGHSMSPSTAVVKSPAFNELQVFGGNFKLNKPLNRASAFAAIEQAAQPTADQSNSMTSMNLAVLQDKFRNVSSNENRTSNAIPWRTASGLRPVDSRTSSDFRTAITDKTSLGSGPSIRSRTENDAVSDIWRAVEKQSYSLFGRVGSTPPTASDFGAVKVHQESQQQQRGLLMKEDSFNRPDSPLFYETLPLPIESAIRRHRQHRDKHKDNSSDHASRCKQIRRQSSSSESDSASPAKGQDQQGQSKGRHRTVRHKPAKQRSASAGARLQGRSPQRHYPETRSAYIAMLVLLTDDR